MVVHLLLFFGLSSVWASPCREVRLDLDPHGYQRLATLDQGNLGTCGAHALTGLWDAERARLTPPTESFRTTDPDVVALKLGATRAEERARTQVQPTWETFRKYPSGKDPAWIGWLSGVSLPEAWALLQKDGACARSDATSGEWASFFGRRQWSYANPFLALAESIAHECEKISAPSAQITLEFKRLAPTIESVSARLEEQRRGTAIAFCSSVLSGEEECGPHFAVIIGERERAGHGCEWLVRNSWGADCHGVSGSLECDAGKVWVSRDELIRTATSHAFMRDQ
jgi:hypothetical protein